MKTKDFYYDLPPELIAQYPLENRTASRLLHITKDVIEDCTFTDIEGFLHEGDLLVANNTKVIKARLLGRKATGGNVEALIERVTGERTAISMVRASKSPKPGTVLYFEADGIEEPVMVTGRQGQFFELEFERPVLDVLEAFGRVPLPPYITHAAQKSDESRYQTVYARYPGAVAAPTAGLRPRGSTSSMSRFTSARGPFSPFASRIFLNTRCIRNGSTCPKTWPRASIVRRPRAAA